MPAGAARQEGPSGAFSLQLFLTLAGCPWPQGGGFPPARLCCQRTLHAEGHQNGSRVSRKLRGFLIPHPAYSSVATLERVVHVGYRTKGVSKHLGCHQESSPGGAGLPALLPGPVPMAAGQTQVPIAGITPIVHQQRTHRLQPRVGKGSPALLSAAAADCHGGKGQPCHPASLPLGIRKARIH